MIKRFRLLAASLAAALVPLGPWTAPAFGEAKPETVVPAPDQTGTIMHTQVLVEGERIDVRQTIAEDAAQLIDARPIIEALKGEISFDATVLVVRRFQDGALMKIDMEDGKVFANDVLLGK
ncbi:MAG: hypothetical protein AAFO57_09070, partial [Pseudomonadota bacterium]